MPVFHFIVVVDGEDAEAEGGGGGEFSRLDAARRGACAALGRIAAERLAVSATANSSPLKSLTLRRRH